MARKRMIDPNIWQSEDFGKLSTLAKLVFIGIFSNADDEGRGRANPTYLKSILFPYEESIRSADIDKTLSEISSNMSVVFYSCDGSNYYSLTKWYDWQKIEKPQDSKLPSFDENNPKIRRLFDDQSATNRRLVEPNRIEENRIENKRKEIKENRNRVIEVYNSLCTNLPKIQKITGKREKNIDLFIKEFTLEQFEEICNIANNSDFLTGNNDRKWKADFDFIMRIDKATSILEGKYNNSKGGINDFKKLWEEAKIEDEQSGNSSSDNSFSW